MNYRFAVMNESIINITYTTTTTSTTTTASTPETSHHDPPLCSIRLHGVALPELALLASLAYLHRDSQDFASFREHLLPDWEFRPIEQIHDSPVIFHDMYSPKLNVSVLTVKVIIIFRLLI